MNHRLVENTITATGSTALFILSGSGHEIRRNAVIGNAGVGILAQVNGVTIAGNNIFGNGSNGANCGLVNLSGGTLVAQGNFWGAASGPGADPADDVCNLSGTTVVDPVAAKPFNIPITAGR